MNIKCLRWQDIYQKFPQAYRQEFTLDVNLSEIFKELTPFLLKSIDSYDIEWIVLELQTSNDLKMSKEKIKEVYGLDFANLPSIKKCYIPNTETENFRLTIIRKVLKPFIKVIMPNAKESEIEPIAEVFYPVIKEAYDLDKQNWKECHPQIISELLSRALYNCYRAIYKQENSHPAWKYGSNFRECLSYWRENQYLYEKNNNLPISNKMASSLYQMFGTCNKPMDTFSDAEWDELFSGTDVKLEHSTVPEEERKRQWEEELQLIEIERQQIIKKIA